VFQAITGYHCYGRDMLPLHFRCLQNVDTHLPAVMQCYKPEERIKKFHCHSNAKPYIYKLKYMMQIFGYLQLVRENSSLLECVVAKLRFITEIQKIIKEGINRFVHSLTH